MSTMDEIEEEAKAAAEKMVMNMMQRPGQLEKVEQYKKRITHKKASIEAQLKSAVQGKLDGVSVGLRQLQECLDDVQQISIKMDELEDLLKGVPPLVASLQAVREEDCRHSQYVTAMDSLKHIFTVPESVAKTKQWIGEGKLLHAHQCLTDLENSRDDLLYELHRLPNQSSHDKIMLKAYFEDVEMVSNLLEKQIKLILARTLNTVRKEPTVIQEDQSGFMPPGRPKNWRAKAFEVLECAVAQRIEGTRVDEREDNKLWLIRYLELTRQLILEDLRVVKTLCVPCFPPHYDIVNKYVNMYHTCLSSSNEYVTLLSWILNTYPGQELMGSPELNIDVSTAPPLLSDEIMNRLQDEYLQRMESNYREWMEKTLESERAEWGGERSPDVEPHTSAFHTHAPVIIFQMIDQNLQVTETISKEITFKALLLSIEQVTRYGNMYREGVIQFKNLRDEAAQFLLEEAFLDLEQHFEDLFTMKWLTSTIPVDTICVTLEDYFQDYNHLRERNFEYVINEAQNLVYRKYITAMLSKKVTFKTVEEAQSAATKIVKEANQIRSFFKKIALAAE
ncbi:unnamed protein product, partial [Leptidea sinapis]